MGKPGTKQRYLLVAVELLGPEPPPPLSALHASIRQSVERHFGADGAREVHGKLQTKHYVPSAALCAVHVPLAPSRMVREAIGLVEFVRQQPVRLRVVRASGSAKCANRELMRRLEAAVEEAAEPRARKQLNGVLAELAEFAKAN